MPVTIANCCCQMMKWIMLQLKKTCFLHLSKKNVSIHEEKKTDGSFHLISFHRFADQKQTKHAPDSLKRINYCIICSFLVERKKDKE